MHVHTHVCVHTYTHAQEAGGTEEKIWPMRSDRDGQES